MIAGVDEAGRGPLAGPVVAAAVILHPGQIIPGLTDSKKLSEKKRESLFDIIQREAQFFAIAEASVEEIDSLNILQATLLAMKRAVERLPVMPNKIIVDGIYCPQVTCASEAIIKGDLTEPAISAASILAKVTRDRLLLQLHEAYPAYGFAQHKGYPTASHLEALKQYGITPHHRRSYAPVRHVLSQPLVEEIS